MNSARNLIIILLLLAAFGACKQSKNKMDAAKGDSLAILNQAIEDNPNDSKLFLQRSKYYKTKSEFSKAIEDAQMAIQIDNKDYDSYLELADLYLITNQIQGTINTLNLILAAKPNHIEANLKMAELNLMFKRYDAAVQSANNVLNSDPYNSKAHFIKGFTFKEYGDTTKAISSFLEAVKQDPDFYNAFVELGILFREKNDPIAVTYFKNAIEVDQSKTDSYYNLAIYYQKNDMLNEAQEVYRRLIEIKPDFPYSYFNMGFILLEISRTPDEAAPYFSKAIQYKPDYYEAHYNLGLCYEEMGDLVKAQTSYQNALKYYNNYPKAIEALNRVDEIMHR